MAKSIINSPQTTPTTTKTAEELVIINGSDLTLADIFTGNNATFDGGGTLDGVMSLPGTADDLITSSACIKYADGATSQDDYFGLEFSVPQGFRGSDFVFTFHYRTEDSGGTTSSSAFRFCVKAMDGADVGLLTDSSDYIPEADDDTNKTAKKYTKVVQCPADCTLIRFGVQKNSTDADQIFRMDNLQVSVDTFRKAQTVGESGYYNISEPNNTMDNSTTDIQFSADLSGTITTNGPYEKYFTVDHSSDPTTITFLQKCKVDMGWLGKCSTSQHAAAIFKNGASLAYKLGSMPDVTSTNGGSQVSSTFIAEKGDYYTFSAVDTTGTTKGNIYSGTAAPVILECTATPLESTSILVESADDVISEWKDAGVIVGEDTSGNQFSSLKGSTVDNDKMKWRRVGDSMEVSIEYLQTATGSAGSGVYKFRLPSGYSIDTNKVTADPTTSTTDQEVVATPIGVGWGGNGQSDNNCSLYVHPWDENYVFMVTGSDLTDAGTGSAVSWDILGSTTHAFSETDLIVSVRFTVPIAGWSSIPKPVLALPTVTVGGEPEHALLSGHNNYGSTATKILEYQNEIYNTLNNLGTLVTDSTNGTVFTALTRCKVTIKASASFDARNWIGLSKNTSDVTGTLSTSPEAEVIAMVRTEAAGSSSDAIFSGILEAGDEVRPHNEGGTLSADTVYGFKFSVLAEPIYGQTNQAAIISPPIAFVEDRKTAGTDGGDFTTGADRTRDLNTLSGDISTVGITLASNQFTLPAGKYEIYWEAPVHNVVNRHQSWLYNITDSVDVVRGSNGACSTNDYDFSSGMGVFTITKSTTFEIRHRCQTTSSTTGFGQNVNTSFTVPYEVYTKAKITRQK